MMDNLEEIIEQASCRIANSIKGAASAGKDECGGTVDSLTEGVMGVTAGLCRIAEAIESLADAIREHEK